MNTATAISLIRVPCAIGLLIWFTDLRIALPLFLVAVAADAIDGMVARRLKQTTALGALVDTLADKFLILCMVIAAMHHGRLDVITLFLLVYRDVWISVGALVALLLRATDQFAVQSQRLGKLFASSQAVAGLLMLVRPDWLLFWAPVVAAVGAASIVEMQVFTHRRCREFEQRQPASSDHAR